MGVGVYKEIWDCASVEMKEAQRDSCMTPSPPRQICHFLALGLVCLFCLMMLTFVLGKLACCKSRICGLLRLQLFGRLRLFFTTSSPKRMNSDDPAALITHLPFTF